ncbi:peptidoglycan-recognition protein SB1-like [Contarinia nasturtii]|uniref:peptidoglycan-recognition protein SB1-like n=1 Tax=Contarinia nasturtii TaxID=265458 RepID=UPI0012D46407|nr:peptidoglycan-recognition protein SB1-like [Contarinia nasturtii]
MLFCAQSVMLLEIVSRDEWGARRAKDVDLINQTVPYVIIHHSYSPLSCNSSEECVTAMQRMQRYHQVERAGDGKVYEGRGFNVIGAHAPGYNNRSIGICLIGDFGKQDAIPTNEMLQATKDLIQHAVEKQYLSNNYTLFGHKQVRATSCPGEALYNEIQSWPHFGIKDDEIKFISLKKILQIL